jgi:hypothetical protein
MTSCFNFWVVLQKPEDLCHMLAALSLCSHSGASIILLSFCTLAHVRRFCYFYIEPFGALSWADHRWAGNLVFFFSKF